jgi:hypothetical protein
MQATFYLEENYVSTSYVLVRLTQNNQYQDDATKNYNFSTNGDTMVQFGRFEI